MYPIEQAWAWQSSRVPRLALLSSTGARLSAVSALLLNRLMLVDTMASELAALRLLSDIFAVTSSTMSVLPAAESLSFWLTLSNPISAATEPGDA
jgi:hypothetical protein